MLVTIIAVAVGVAYLLVNQPEDTGKATYGCNNICSYSGLRICAGTYASGYYRCADYNYDGCLEWGALLSCSPGYVCSGGVCQTVSCDSDAVCDAGETCSCSDCNGKQDGCVAGKVCSGGNCVYNGSKCSNECSYSGYKQCSGTSGYQTCGNYDSDSCLEWSSTSVSCSFGYTCNSGTCAMTACSNECPYSGQKVCYGTGYKYCGQFDSDSCYELGSTVYSCGYNKKCINGVCVSSGGGFAL